MREDGTGTKATEDQVVPDLLGRQMQMDYVVRKKLRVMQNKEWFVRWRGKPLFKVRDQVDRIVKVVQFVSGVASQVATLDPLHAGLAWAGVCVILPVSMIVRFQVRWYDLPQVFRVCLFFVALISSLFTNFERKHSK
jgi:N-terminal domain of NWD NACHT-NTPase